MTPELAFSICSTLVLPQWLLMIVAPKWEWTQKLVASRIIPFILAIFYAYYILTSLGSAEGGGFGSLQEVMQLFTVEKAVLAGWIHYLAFDLLIGGWVLKTAQKKGIHHGLVIPCLIGCFMLGPIGFLVFWLICKFKE